MTRQEQTIVCPRDCYDTCSLNVVIENGSIESIRGNPNCPITRGITCPRAAKDAERLAKNRVLFPYLQISRNTERSRKRVSWKHAINTVATQLKKSLSQYGSQKVLLLDYLGNTGLLTWYFPRRFWNALGATRTDYSLCAKSGNKAISQYYGKSYGILPENLLDCDVHVYWGFNAAVSSPHLWNLSQIARRETDAKIVVIDPRRSKSAKLSDLWLGIKPGSDLALAYGLANQLIINDYIDYEFIQTWTSGYEDFEGKVIEWDLERTAKETDIPSRAIAELAKVYGKATKSSLLLGVGFQKAKNGALATGVASLLPSLTGHHRGFFYSNGSGFDIATDYLQGITLTNKSPRVVSQVNLSEHISAGEFKFIFCYNMNPVLTVPNQAALRNGLEREDVFLVVHETHWTETTDYADVVLPAPTYLEKRDVAIPWAHNHVRISCPVVEPQGESRSEVWLMQKLAKSLGMEQDWLYDNPWNCLAIATSSSFTHGDLEDLESGKSLNLRYRSMSSYYTKSGKIELAANLPDYEAIRIPYERLILLNSALPNYTHTQFQEVYGPIPSVAHIHPLDAQERNIQQDDIIILSNSQGDIFLEANVSPDVQKGTIWTPREGKGINGVPLNALTSGAAQSLGGGPVFNSTLVSVRLHEKS